MTALLILVVSALLAVIAVGQIRRFALQKQMIDIPNERSSHTIPTPRGGGLGIVVVVLVGTLLLALFRQIQWNVTGAIFVGGFVAFIGYLDDRGGISPTKRASVHFASAVLGVALLGGMPPLDLGFTILEWGWLGNILAVIGIVWMINLYNFMDGIDGLAGSESVFVFAIAGLLLTAAGLSSLSLVCVLFVGASLGFLFWNWHPAKIFMGDVGSGFLGYSIAIIAIVSGNQGFNLWVWIILLAVFVVDATITLLRRVLRREKWYQPHRSHAYQHLTQRWGSHLKVTLVVLAINLLWLAPLAYTLTTHTQWALIAVIVGFLPLVGLALLLGAGKNTPGTSSHSVAKIKSADTN